VSVAWEHTSEKSPQNVPFIQLLEKVVSPPNDNNVLVSFELI